MQKDRNSLSNQALIEDVRAYWDSHIHDLEIATSPVGSPGFFRELEDYRYDKLAYLPGLVNFEAYSGLNVLEIGCGVGLDLLRFAGAGAHVVGIDLSPVAIGLAQANFRAHELPAELVVMNGEALDFPDNHFDLVYAHGVLQYTADMTAMLSEIRRVLKPGGSGILMVYNRISWLRAVSKLTGVPLEHEDAPVYRTCSIPEFRRHLSVFSQVEIVPERFPVRTQLHSGLKAKLFNDFFVRGFNLLPRRLVRPLGWHLVAFARK